MSRQVEIVRPIIDYDETYAQAAITNANTFQTVASLRTKSGKRCFVTLVANVIDPSAVDYVTWEFRKNGASFHPFGTRTAQWSDPALISPNPLRVEVGQYDLLEVMAKVSGSGPASSSAWARIMVEYEDFPGQA